MEILDVFPLKLRWLLRLPWLHADRSIPDLMKRLNKPYIGPADPMSIIKRAIPENLPIKVTAILPRL